MTKRSQRPRELEQHLRRLKKLRPARDQRCIEAGIRAVLHLTGGLAPSSFYCYCVIA
jgi:hypothetical protein